MARAGVSRTPYRLPKVPNFTWHCLRHTLASNLVMRVDIGTVQELMGHKTIQMSLRYAHLALNINWQRCKGCAILGRQAARHRLHLKNGN